MMNVHLCIHASNETNSEFHNNFFFSFHIIELATHNVRAKTDRQASRYHCYLPTSGRPEAAVIQLNSLCEERSKQQTSQKLKFGFFVNFRHNPEKIVELDLC